MKYLVGIVLLSVAVFASAAPQWGRQRRPHRPHHGGGGYGGQGFGGGPGYGNQGFGGGPSFGGSGWFSALKVKSSTLSL